MVLQTYPSQQSLVNAGIEHIRETTSKRSVNAHIALSGGSTPRPLYVALSRQKNIAFENVTFWQVDERYTEPQSLHSNQLLIRTTLLKTSTESKKSKFHFFDTSLPITTCLSSYESKLKQHIKENFDLIILGMGADGHTASLFPHTKALDETTKWTTHTTTNKFAVTNRLSLTFPVILASKQLLLLLAGEDKRTTLDELLYGKKSIDEFPAKKLLEHRDLTILFTSDKS